jgi:hypothetical protein
MVFIYLLYLLFFLSRHCKECTNNHILCIFPFFVAWHTVTWTFPAETRPSVRGRFEYFDVETACSPFRYGLLNMMV